MAWLKSVQVGLSIEEYKINAMRQKAKDLYMTLFLQHIRGLWDRG